MTDQDCKPDPIYDLDLPANKIMVLMAIAKGSISIPWIAYVTKYSKPQIWRILDALKKDKLVIVTRASSTRGAESMAKCQILKGQEADWAWQPFGPSDNPLGSFTMLGSHYRGFPVIKISDEAYCRIHAGETLNFTYQQRLYTVKADGVYEVTFKA